MVTVERTVFMTAKINTETENYIELNQTQRRSKLAQLLGLIILTFFTTVVNIA